MILPTARAFAPLLKAARYKGAYGGRGSGKSHFFAELLIERCLARPATRAVCVREVQRSLDQSVKALLAQKIAAMGVSRGFSVLESEIHVLDDTGERRGRIIFQGMQNHTAESVKSLEGFDIAWVEEAQALSARSLALLTPTLRAPGAEIWFSWNPRRADDPVDAFMRGPGAAEDPDIACVAVNWHHNLSTAAQYRIRLSQDPNFTSSLADSGWMDVWPTVYPFGTLPWGSPSWWTGKYAPDQIERYTGAVIHVLSGLTAARYLRVEISDTGNADGFVQIGRLFAADGWQPTRNMTYGASLAWEDRTQVQEALSGAEYFDARPMVRIARFGLDAMTESEAMSQAFEVQRAMGVSGEVLFIWNPDDTNHAQRRQFLGRLRTLSPIENPGPDRWKAPFEIKELL
jgi:hypothetical protein